MDAARTVAPAASALMSPRIPAEFLPARTGRRQEVPLAQSEHVAFERLLADVSASFVNRPAAEVDGLITDALRRIVLLLDVDRSHLVRFDSDIREAATITHTWTVPGVPAARPRIIEDDFPWAIGRLRAGETVLFSALAEVPSGARVDRATWLRIGTRSHLSIPLRVAGRVEGFLAFACMKHERDWPDALVERIGALADVFANALAHKRAQESLDVAMKFERGAADVLASLLTAGLGQRDRMIEAALRDIAELFDVDRATLWQRIGRRAEFAKTHRWLSTSARDSVDSTGTVGIAWIASELVAGNIVSFRRLADLPAAAEQDVRALRAIGIEAALIAPLRLREAVIGAISLDSSRQVPAWPDALVPRIKLLGEVFAALQARDESERREREAEAQAAHAARIGTMGVVAASLVHELTQPLAASLANAETAAELLADPEPDLGELRATMDDIVADDRRVVDLIAQLRRFLRRGTSVHARLNLRELVDDVLRFVRGEAARRKIEVVVACDAALPVFVGDRVQLQQVLLNLVLNAFDAVTDSAPDSRRVTIIGRAEAEIVILEVADEGHGMDEATVARVFQPFFTTKPGGMGLGLSISRTIVASQGGALSVRSAPGRGTTFRVDLPFQPPEPVRPTTEPLAATMAEGTVVVIDDDESMRRALERQLGSAGYHVQSFASAGEYLAQPLTAGVACILSDVRMPGGSGLDLQEALAEAKRELPIVFVSGHGDIPTTVRAMRAGAVGFLSKPFSKGELRATVAEAIEKSRSLQEARGDNALLETRYATLTPREREVLALVVGGLLNKVIADRLGAAETTIKIHRGRVMAKMAATSVADLVRMAQRLGLPIPSR